MKMAHSLSLVFENEVEDITKRDIVEASYLFLPLLCKVALLCTQVLPKETPHAPHFADRKKWFRDFYKDRIKMDPEMASLYKQELESLSKKYRSPHMAKGK